MNSFEPSQKPVKFGRYLFIRKIARGGMGIVYLAMDTVLDRPVALKLLLEKKTREGSSHLRFGREVKLASRLNHPNIVNILDFGEEEGKLYYVMEYIEGGDLKKIIQTEGPLPLEKAAQLICTLSQAIHYAHENHIIHRDLKPANIMIDPMGNLKIADFGLAKDLRDDANLTQTGAMIGSPAYMAPEQLQGKAADRRGDVYALGVILFEMLTGKPPYKGKGIGSIYAQILNKPTPSPRKIRSQIPHQIDGICQKAMAKEPENRYPTALALGEALQEYLKTSPPLSQKRDEDIQTPWATISFRKFLAGGVGLVLFVGIILLWFIPLNPILKNSTPSPSGPTRTHSLKNPCQGQIKNKAEEKIYQTLCDSLDKGSVLDVLEKLNGVIKLDPGFKKAYLLRAKCWIYLEEMEKAERDLNHLQKELKDSGEFQMIEVHIFYYKKEYSKAWDLCERLRKKGYQSGDLYLAMARLKERKKKYEQALSYLDQAIRFSSCQARFLQYKIRIFLNSLKDYITAISTSTLAIQKFPQHFYFYVLRGRAYMNLGKLYGDQNLFSKAGKDFEDGFKRFPQTSAPLRYLTNRLYELYYHWGKNYYYLESYSKALSLFRKSLFEKPTAPSPYQWIGMCFEKMGKEEKALETYQKGLSVKFERSLSVRLSYLYLKKRKFSKALTLSSIALENFPRDDETHLIKGIAHYYRKEYEEARLELLQVFNHCKDPGFKKQAQDLLKKIPR